MSETLVTPRLNLLPLSAVQLAKCLDNLSDLGTELGLTIPASIIDLNVIRAIDIKLSKMAEADVSLHPWFTYWLMIIRSAQTGAGFIGFKGYLDSAGKSEIGYGIAEEFRNQGYTTESVQTLSRWAFLNPHCRELTATTVSNPASEKVLQKAGWQKIKVEKGSSDWHLLRKTLNQVKTR
jgi:[ribosomal protein S5]-alanine N-acetyltransferase